MSSLRWILKSLVAVDKEELHRRINALAQDPDTSFRLKSVTYMKLFGRSKPCGPTALLVRITFQPNSSS